MKYEVTFVVLANYTTMVEASSKEEAKKLAREAYCAASLGDYEWVNDLDVRIEHINN